jgi:hypothetical protein
MIDVPRFSTGVAPIVANTKSVNRARRTPSCTIYVSHNPIPLLQKNRPLGGFYSVLLKRDSVASELNVSGKGLKAVYEVVFSRRLV